MESKEAKLQSAIEAAQSIINGAIDPIIGIRRICSVGHYFSHISEFRIFSGYDSETDGFHRDEEVREHYGEALLQRLDAEADAYIEAAKEDIDEACRELIKALESIGVKLPLE